MNKAEIIEGIAEKAGLSKAAAAKALDAFIEVVTNALKKKEKVSIPGFGTFSVSKRKKRTMTAPGGKTVEVPARNVPRFKAGKGLKEAVK